MVLLLREGRGGDGEKRGNGRGGDGEETQVAEGRECIAMSFLFWLHRWMVYIRSCRQFLTL